MPYIQPATGNPLPQRAATAINISFRFPLFIGRFPSYSPLIPSFSPGSLPFPSLIFFSLPVPVPLLRLEGCGSFFSPFVDVVNPKPPKHSSISRSGFSHVSIRPLLRRRPTDAERPFTPFSHASLPRSFFLFFTLFFEVWKECLLFRFTHSSSARESLRSNSPAYGLPSLTSYRGLSATATEPQKFLPTSFLPSPLLFHTVCIHRGIERCGGGERVAPRAYGDHHLPSDPLRRRAPWPRSRWWSSTCESSHRHTESVVDGLGDAGMLAGQGGRGAISRYGLPRTALFATRTARADSPCWWCPVCSKS